MPGAPRGEGVGAGGGGAELPDFGKDPTAPGLENVNRLIGISPVDLAPNDLAPTDLAPTDLARSATPPGSTS